MARPSNGNTELSALRRARTPILAVKFSGVVGRSATAQPRRLRQQAPALFARGGSVACFKRGESGRREHAIKLDLKPLLRGLRRSENLVELQEIKNLKSRGAGLHKNVGPVDFELHARDGFFENEGASEQGFRCGRVVASLDGGRCAANIDCDDDIDPARQQIERQRIAQAAIDQRTAFVDHGVEYDRERHARSDGLAEWPVGKRHRSLLIEVGRDDDHRYREVGKIAGQPRRQNDVEHGFRIKDRRALADEPEQFGKRGGARCEQFAQERKALAQDHLGVGADFTCRHAGGIGRAEDGANRGAGDDLRFDAKFVEGFKHQDVGQPARATAAERQPYGRRRLSFSFDRSRHGRAGSYAFAGWLVLTH